MPGARHSDRSASSPPTGGATATVVAVSGFVGAYLVPQLKYPANPPGINSGDTAVPRVESYLVGLVVVCLVVWVARFVLAPPEVLHWRS